MNRWTILTTGMLAIWLLSTGCSKPDEISPTADTAASAPRCATGPGHTHGSGPHGGVVFDLGAHHAEFTVDHDKQQVTVVILGGDAKTPLPVAATELTAIINETKTADGKAVPAMTIALRPTGTAGGKAATFVGADPGIGNVADFGGTITGEIDGKPALGTFQE